MELKNTEAIILCGGKGTRLKSIFPNTQKTMVKVGNKVFLELVLDHLASQGINKFVLCVGHLKEQVKKHFQKKTSYQIKFCEENNPLGTGGAVKKAITLTKSENVLVLNGDTICKVDLREFFEFHKNKNALVSMVLSESKRKDGGQVVVDDSGKIIHFSEKQGKTNLINAGIYIINRNAFHLIKKRIFSLEKDFFPLMINKNFFGHLTKEKVIDIGTPQTYLQFTKSLKKSFLIANRL